MAKKSNKSEIKTAKRTTTRKNSSTKKKDIVEKVIENEPVVEETKLEVQEAPQVVEEQDVQQDVVEHEPVIEEVKPEPVIEEVKLESIVEEKKGSNEETDINITSKIPETIVTEMQPEEYENAKYVKQRINKPKRNAIRRIFGYFWNGQEIDY